MFIRHNPDSFLSGDYPFLRSVPVDASAGRFEAQLLLEVHHEGAIGIPHGGLTMGLCLDVWHRFGLPHYPVDVSFKFGGSGLRIGDTALVSVTLNHGTDGPHLIARITKPGDKSPYLRTEIKRVTVDGRKDLLPPPPSDRLRKLPYYRNCFVCGHHRSIPGLQRRFRFHSEPGSHVVSVPWCNGSDDLDRARLFLIGEDELHPAVIVSIFDENTGWAGFLATKQAGLTVRMQLTLLRPVGATEPLLFASRPAGIRGNSASPRFFSGEGTVLSMKDPGNPQVVAYGRGEWIILDFMTEQVKRNLLPEDDWQWIFS